MKKIEARFLEARKFFEKNANPDLVKKYSRYFTEGYDAYGISQALYEAQRAKWLETWKKELPFDELLRLGDKLISTGKYEEASLAVGIVYSSKEHFTPETFERMGVWLEKWIRNWAHTDVLSGLALSDFIARGIVSIDTLGGWTESPSKWRRRSVPVMMIDLLKTEIPLKRMLATIAPLMEDADKFVQKGLGWFLREAWKVRPVETEKFLLKWKDTCGRTIIQYATEKMDKKEKERFRKAKKTF